ncbi:FtsX-like permease family protein, partial [Candidatus Nomurabacteria bacterium]|nr:FtsX-like permease family protein [Candidatus Nomurabacteria bacterium]
MEKESYVKRAEFISKEKGAEEMKKMLGEDFLEVFDVNPIPLSVDLYLKAEYLESDSLKTIAAKITEMPDVKEVAYQESLVKVINQNLEKIGVVLSIVLALLLFISFVLINNTVRLNVYSKRFTIQTMKLVGAKRSFIRKPFIRQGIYQGMFAGVISSILLVVALFVVKRDINQLFVIFDMKLIAMVLIGVILIATAALFGNMDTETLLYSDIVTMFNNGEVKAFEIDEKNNLTILTHEEETYSFRLLDVSIFYNDLNETVLRQLADGTIENYNYAEPVEIPWWVSLLPYVLLIALFIGLWFYVMNQTTGKGGKLNTFGKARAKLGSDEKKKVYFRDVAGADEEKEELRE